MRMRIWGVALTVAVVAMAGVVSSPSAAHAGQKWVYSSKFMCPNTPGGFPVPGPPPGPGLGGGFAGNIYYETVTTVMNADNRQGHEIKFNKYFVLALRQHQLSSFDGVYGGDRITAPIGHILEPGDAISIDCDSVLYHLYQNWAWGPGVPYSPYGRLDGVIVIETEDRELVVQTLYGVVVTNQGSPHYGEGGVSVDVENVTPVHVKGGFQLAVDNFN
jgi:hypothetical protein